MITFTVKRIDGTTESLMGHRFDTLIDVMGVQALTNIQVFVNGKVVNKFMTLSHENIINGCVLFAAKSHLIRIKRQMTNGPLISWLDDELTLEVRKQQERTPFMHEWAAN
jgi:hypothetical protein